MLSLLTLLLTGLSLDLPAAASHVGLEASFVPPAHGASGAVLVHFMPLAEGVKVNQEPAPRLRLETTGILLDRQPPQQRTVPVDPDFARYFEPSEPARFPVAIDPAAPRGQHVVRATVTYSYCSKTQGWCRRGSEPVEVLVQIP